MKDVINGVVQYQDLYDVLMQTNLNYACTLEKDEYIAKGVQVMLNRVEEYKKLIEKVKDKDCSLGCENCNAKISCNRIRLIIKWGYIS